MSAPRVVIRYFNHGEVGNWSRLARVAQRSIARHCPSWALDVVEMPPPTFASPMGNQGHVANTVKLDAWAAAVHQAADGDRILLLDADTLIRRPLDDVWDRAFDLAYTVKPAGSSVPFNGGVLFVRVSAGTKLFMRQWSKVNQFLLERPLHFQVWRGHFAGLNQSALGMLFTGMDAPWRASAEWPEEFRTYRHGLDVLRLPCLEWNCEDESWDAFDPDVTRLVHYKSGLQRAVLGKREPGPVPRHLIAEWRAMEDADEDDEPVSVEPIQAPGVGPDRNMQITPTDLQQPPPPRLSKRQRRRQAEQQARGA